MKSIINLENIVADYFNQNPDREHITQETISQLVDIITTNFTEYWITVCIDNTSGALNFMLSTNTEFFEKNNENDSIYLKNRSDLLPKTKHYFNLTLNNEIKEIYLQIIENFREPIK